MADCIVLTVHNRPVLTLLNGQAERERDGQRGMSDNICKCNQPAFDPSPDAPSRQLCWRCGLEVVDVGKVKAT